MSTSPKFKETAMARNPDGSLAYRYGPLLVFALNTGFREGELLALSKSRYYDSRWEARIPRLRNCQHRKESG